MTLREKTIQLLNLLKIGENTKFLILKMYKHDRDIVNIINQFDFNTLCIHVAPIYEDRFTEKELEELISFYESPIGQKYLTNSTEMFHATQTETEKWALKELIRLNIKP